MKDCEVINAFVVYLCKNGHFGLKVDRWPDKENRDSEDIDALAGIFAIEHTSVDTLPNQRRDSNWFFRVVGGLEKELPSVLPFRLTITVEYPAIAVGQDWGIARLALKTWITYETSPLADGRHVLDNISDLPFRLYVTKASGRPPGVFFSRFEPSDSTLPKRLRAQLDRKAKKLAKYQTKTKILLIENNDIALMNELKMRDAIQKAYPSSLPIGIDQIWFADTAIPDELEFIDFTPIVGS
jgi:hypothetical protein